SINIVIALKSSSTNADLKNINQFMMNINQYCDDRSMISIFAPGYRNEECKSFNESMFEHMVDDLLGGLQSFVIDDADSTYETTRDLYFQQLKCSMTDPSQLGGLTIVFTNSDCKDYCTFNDRTWHDPIDNPRWTQLYYSGDWDDCVTDAPSVFDFLDCENNQGKCNYTKLSLSDLNEEESSMRTCKNSSTLNATQLLIIIGIICLSMIVIALGCAYFCYKKSNIRWRKFFLREQLQKGNITVQDFKELSAPCGQPPSAEVMAKLTYKDSSVSSPLRNMNHYSEHFMRTMNEDPCEWEIGPGNLLILENKVLGHGAFATVCKGVISGRIPLLDVYPTLSLNCKHGDEIEVAVKRMPNHADEYARSDFYKEIEFMKTLGYHRHVISMFGAVTTSIDPILVVEYCQNGDLLRFLRGKNKHILASDDEDCPVDAEICLRVKDLVSIAWQIADGMSYLSSLNFIHRDLAARNVLLTSSLVAKISDFGLGRHVDSTLYMAKGGRLPLKWMPPEALKFNEFSQKSDVWSFGIVLYELFSLGKQPFPLVQPFEMVEHIENGGRPPQPALCPDPVFEVQSWSLSLLSSDRPTFEEAKNALSDLLNTNDEKYGYLDLAGKSSSSKLHEIMNNIAQIEENDEEEGEESADPPSQEIEWLYIGERSVPKCDRKRSASMNIDSSPSSLIPSSPLTRAASSNLFERRKEFLRQSSMERGQSIDVSSPQELIYPNIIVTTPTPRAGSVVEAATTTSECASRCECGFEAPPPYSESWPASHRCHRTMEEGLEGIGSIMP
ncbi:hypothetical protein PMAYCL1PPCAC_07536, partial [Pristionchus mayeri]